MPDVPPKQTEIAWDEILNHSFMRLQQHHSILATMNRIENPVYQLL